MLVSVANIPAILSSSDLHHQICRPAATKEMKPTISQPGSTPAFSVKPVISGEAGSLQGIELQAELYCE
jgi:hypothetical protein